jgi:hypothetical protein
MVNDGATRKVIALLALFALGAGLVVSCGEDGSTTAVVENGAVSPGSGDVAEPATSTTEPDDPKVSDGEPPGADIELAEGIDECLVGLWQADNASWSAAFGGLSVTGTNLWLLLADGLSLDSSENFQIAGATTLNMLSQGSWAAQGGQIRWDSYDISSDASFEIPGAVRIDVDLRDRSAIRSVVSAAGVRTEGILDFSAEDDPESDNGPWTAPYTCEGERFVLNRDGQALVYNLVERW